MSLVVLGKPKSGRSSFINCLLGDDFLPTGYLLTTSVPTIIEFDSGCNDVCLHLTQPLIERFDCLLLRLCKTQPPNIKSFADQQAFSKFRSITSNLNSKLQSTIFGKQRCRDALEMIYSVFHCSLICGICDQSISDPPKIVAPKSHLCFEINTTFDLPDLTFLQNYYPCLIDSFMKCIHSSDCIIFLDNDSFDPFYHDFKNTLKKLDNVVMIHNFDTRRAFVVSKMKRITLLAENTTNTTNSTLLPTHHQEWFQEWDTIAFGISEPPITNYNINQLCAMNDIILKKSGIQIVLKSILSKISQPQQKQSLVNLSTEIEKRFHQLESDVKTLTTILAVSSQFEIITKDIVDFFANQRKLSYDQSLKQFILQIKSLWYQQEVNKISKFVSDCVVLPFDEFELLTILDQWETNIIHNLYDFFCK